MSQWPRFSAQKGTGCLGAQVQSFAHLLCHLLTYFAGLKQPVNEIFLSGSVCKCGKGLATLNILLIQPEVGSR